MGTHDFRPYQRIRSLVLLTVVCTGLAFLPGVAARGASSQSNLAGLVTAGRISIESDWTGFSFPVTLAEAPIVVAGPASWEGRDPATVQVRGVSRYGFAKRLLEWPYLDFYHTRETVSYLAIPPGRHVLPSGAVVEAGSSSVAAGGSHVSFETSFEDRPVVITTLGSSEVALAVRTDVSKSGFTVRLDPEEADLSTYAGTINWVAWSSGSDTGGRDGVAWETLTKSINNTFTALPFAGAYARPCVYADMNTINGGDTATLRYREWAGRIEVRVDEERSADHEIAHAAENVAILVMECEPPVAAQPFIAPDFEFGHVFPSSPVVLSGFAADNRGVSRVIVGIKDRNRDLWLQDDLTTWGSFDVFDATVETPGARHTRWSIGLDLPRGDYSLMARVVIPDGGHTVEVTPYRHFSVGADVTAPAVSVDSPAGTEFTNPVLLSGGATDDTAVERVRLAVRDRVTKLWLQSDELSWSSVYHGFAPTTAVGLDSPEVVWTLALTLPEGRYNLSVRARDWAGNWHEMAPWREFSVHGPESRLFGDSGQRLGSSQTMRIGVGDLDGDRDVDVFAANGIDSPNLIWINDGAGLFRDSGQRLGSAWSWGVDVGDVDDDGDVDVFVANYAYGQPNMVWFNSGTGSFTDGGQRLGDSWSLSVALGDLDGDGSPDAFVGNYQPNRVWLNDGDGNFEDSGQAVQPWVNATVALGDLDHDGDLDAFLANHGWTGPQANHVLVNDGSGRFMDSGQHLGFETTVGVALADLDGDGDLDGFAANHGANIVWINDGSGGFTDSGQRLGNQESVAVALGDIDRDGDVDAFVGNHGGNRIWLNDGGGSFSGGGLLLGNLDSVDVALVDFDGDSDLDAWVGEDGPNTVWMNTTEGS